MAGIFDDLGKGIMNAASEAVTGMSNEERDALVAKMMSGNMDFNDFLKMTLLMQSQGGVGGVMSSVSSIPGLRKTLGMDDINMDDAEDKMGQFAKVIAAMTEEERGMPGYFLLGEGASARVAALAEKAEMPKETVDEFFEQFNKMKTLMTKLGVGFREGKSKDQIAKEMEKEAKEEEAVGKGPSKNTPFVNPERRKKKLEKMKAAAAKRPPPPRGAGGRDGRDGRDSRRTGRR